MDDKLMLPQFDIVGYEQKNKTSNLSTGESLRSNKDHHRRHPFLLPSSKRMMHAMRSADG
jgi:hypothetical protein